MAVEWRTPIDKEPNTMGRYFNLIATWGKDQTVRVKQDLKYGYEKKWFGLGFDGFLKKYAIECTKERLKKYFETFDDIKIYYQYVEPMAKYGGDGGKVEVDNINTESKGGTSSEYLVRRLKRDFPQIADKVIKGELSPFAGAVEAGFKKRMVSIEPTVEGVYNFIQKNFKPSQIKELKKLI